MNKYILIAFVVMGAAYWYLSGGASYEREERKPETRLTTRLTPEVTPVAFEPVPSEPSVLFAPEPAVPFTEPVAAEPPQSLSELFGAPLETAPDAAAAPRTGQEDLRVVSGDSVNLRDGPGTSFGVVGKLTRNTEVVVLDTDASGWQHIRVTSNGITGWMSGNFLAFAE